MTQLPDTDHVSRLCSKKQITEDGRVSGAAFQVRPIDNGRLSVNWVEKLGLSSRPDEIKALSEIYAAKVKRYPITGSSISILNIGKTKNHVHESSEDKRLLEFFPNENANDKSHATINNVKLDEEIVPELIAQTVIEKYVID